MWTSGSHDFMDDVRMEGPSWALDLESMVVPLAGFPISLAFKSYFVQSGPQCGYVKWSRTRRGSLKAPQVIGATKLLARYIISVASTTQDEAKEQKNERITK